MFVADGSGDARTHAENSKGDFSVCTAQSANDRSQLNKPQQKFLSLICCNSQLECRKCCKQIWFWILAWLGINVVLTLGFWGVWWAIVKKDNKASSQESTITNSTSNFATMINTTNDTSVEACVIGVDNRCWAAFLFSAETQLSITIVSGLRMVSTECPRFGFVVVFQSLLGKVLYTLLVGLVFNALWCNQTQPQLIKDISHAVKNLDKTVQGALKELKGIINEYNTLVKKIANDYGVLTKLWKETAATCEQRKREFENELASMKITADINEQRKRELKEELTTMKETADTNEQRKRELEVELEKMTQTADENEKRKCELEEVLEDVIGATKERHNQLTSMTNKESEIKEDLNDIKGKLDKLFKLFENYQLEPVSGTLEEAEVSGEEA